MAFTMLYVWQDLDLPESDQKFGDHFTHAKTLEEAVEDTKRYVRSSLARQKHRFDEGRIVIHKMWDATEYAKRIGRFGPHQKVDDAIRHVIGHHLQNDWHRIDSDALIERVNRELIKHGQPLPMVGLSQPQYRAAENVLFAVRDGRRTIVAELCARFGKTIWSGALIRETNAQLTIVASYVLTVIASFKKDLSSFEQFRDLVLIDTADDDWEFDLDTALKNDQQVVVFLSMCGGGRRQNKIDRLFSVDLDGYGRLVLIDEADFGMHRTAQSQPLIDARGEQDVIVLMTGTNGDKAASIWPVDHYLNVTYTELLMDKHADRLIA